MAKPHFFGRALPIMNDEEIWCTMFSALISEIHQTFFPMTHATVGSKIAGSLAGRFYMGG